MKDTKSRTDDLPKLDCSNCDYFKKRWKAVDTYYGRYGLECSNVTWPLEECAIKGFKFHSEKDH